MKNNSGNGNRNTKDIPETQNALDPIFPRLATHHLMVLGRRLHQQVYFMWEDNKQHDYTTLFDAVADVPVTLLNRTWFLKLKP